MLPEAPVAVQLARADRDWHARMLTVRVSASSVAGQLEGAEVATRHADRCLHRFPLSAGTRRPPGGGLATPSATSLSRSKCGIIVRRPWPICQQLWRAISAVSTNPVM